MVACSPDSPEVKKDPEAEAKKDERKPDGVDPLAMPLVQKPKGDGELARRHG